MTRQLINRILVLAFLVIIISESVVALGVTPARRVIPFEAGKTIGYEFNVLNTEGEDQLLAVYPVGEFAEHITLEKNLLTLSKNDNKAVVRLNINLPESADPGTQKTNVMIAKLPLDAGIKDDLDGEVFSGNLASNVGASIVVAHQLWVEVPYPGKFIKAKLRKQEFDSKPEFVISVFNLGTESLNEVSARIEVLGATYEELTELRTQTISISSGKEGKLSAIMENANVEPGVYRARAVITYDGKTLVLEDNFFIGESNIEIKDLTVNNFRLGTIAKLNLLLESNWNKPIEEIYGEFDVLKNGQKVGNFLTAPKEIQPHAEETLIGYWDTEGFEVGNYDVLVKVHYQGKTTERLYDTVVAVDSVKFGSGSAVGKVSGARGEGGNQFSLLLLMMIVLVGINVALFFYIRRGRQ